MHSPSSIASCGLVVLVTVLMLGLPSTGAGTHAPSLAGPASLVGAAPRCDGPAAAGCGVTPVPSARSAATSGAVAWTQLDGEGVGNLSGAGLADDSPSQLALQFGGLSASGLTNTTRLYDERTNTWTTLPIDGPTPSPRSSFALASDPVLGLAVLFGGQTNATTGASTNDTWVFDFGDDRWTNVTESVAPGPRQSAAFSIAPDQGLGVLYGGWDPDFEGTGQVTYSDTWEFNLSSDAWTRLSPGGDRPPAVYGSSLTWDPVAEQFLMFGGCYPCSSGVWEFDLTSADWTSLATGGTAPGPRMESAWAYDPALDADVLFGGTDGSSIAGDTYLFFAGAALWTLESALPAPSPRYGQAATWLNVTDNETLLMTGGLGQSGPVNETWRLASTASLSVSVVNATSLAELAGASVALDGGVPVATNASGDVTFNNLVSAEATVLAVDLGYAPVTTSVWLAPGQATDLTVALRGVATETLDVAVNDTAGDVVAGAYVNVSAGGAAPIANGTTGPEGWVNFTGVPAFTGSVSAWSVGYHTSLTDLPFAPGQTLVVRLTLLGLALLDVQVTGRLPNGTVVPLNGATVRLGTVYLGSTDILGTLTVPTSDFGSAPVNVTAPYFAGNQTIVVVPATGTVYANLELDSAPAGSLVVTVVDATTQAQVPSVRVNFTRLAPTTVTPLQFGEDASRGLLFASLLAGNYSLTVWAPGYETNASVPVEWIQPGVIDPITVELTRVPLGAVDTIILDAVSHRPIPGATVEMPTVATLLTGPSGWANFTGLSAGTFGLIASAPGYETNETAVTLTVGQVVARFPVNLTPAPSGNGPGGQNSLALLPPDAVSVWPLLVLPFVAVGLALVYLTVLRAPEAPAPEPDGTPPEPEPIPRRARRWLRRGGGA